MEVRRLGCAVAISANGDPARLAKFRLPVLPDSLPERPGPLAGVLAGMDQYTRFWPAELMPGFEALDPASRLSRWNIGGFELIADVVAQKIRTDLKPDPQKIRALMSKIEVNPALEIGIVTKKSVKTTQRDCSCFKISEKSFSNTVGDRCLYVN